MSNTSQRRLFKDLQKIQSEELPGAFCLLFFLLSSSSKNIFVFRHQCNTDR